MRETLPGKLMMGSLALCVLALAAAMVPGRAVYLDMLLDDGRVAEALRRVEAAPRDAETLEARYRLAVHGGDRAAAEAALLEMSARHPKDRRATDQLAAFYASHGRMRDYRELLGKADPRSLSQAQRTELVALLRYEGLHAAERTTLAAIAEAGLADAGALERLAMLDLAAGKEAAALERLPRLEADHALSRQSLLALLSLLLDKGDAVGAAGLLEARLALRPDKDLFEWWNQALAVRGLPVPESGR